MTRSVLITTLRNEGPFLLEWVAYHRLLGFSEILVAFNDCDDGSEELLMALESIGWLRALRNEGTAEPPQVAARTLFTQGGLLGFGDWVLWIDLDEFLNIHLGNRRLPDLLEAMGPARAMLLAWRIFGDGQGAPFGGRFIDDAFCRAAKRSDLVNDNTKTLLRFDDSIEELTIHRPRYVEGRAPETAQVLLGDGTPMHDNRRNARWRVRRTEGVYPRLDPHEIRWDWAQINHYAIRTFDLYPLKVLRGLGDKLGGRNRRHTAEFYDKMNRNEGEDRSILGWQDAVGAAMAEALADPGVRAAQDLVARRLAENLEKVAGFALP